MEQDSSHRRSLSLDSRGVRGIHITLLAIAVLCASLYAAIQFEGGPAIWVAVIVTIVTLFFWELLLYWRASKGSQYEGSIVSHVIMIGAVYLTGGATSPFVAMLLPVSMLLGLRADQKRALWNVGQLVLLYSCLVVGVATEVIPPADVSMLASVPGGAALHLLGIASALVLLTVCTGYLTRSSRSVIEASEREVIELQGERDALKKKLRVIEEQLRIEDEMTALLKRVNEAPQTFETRVADFIGESKLMQQVFKLITRVAPTEATTLITGESGTGKELVARAIHLGSKRADNAFVVVNCGAIPENLMESEFFGHKKGSFTGAFSDHKGLFEEAHQGTLFLDEIGELPLAMQVKLLRVLQERTIRPVGGTKDIAIDVRIIAATNRTLKREVREGKFREDLYYRLNVVSIHLPALRERKEDLPFLVQSVLKKFLREDGTPSLSPHALKLLMGYSYPGNVRELENILERAVVLSGDVILPEHLPESLQEPVGLVGSGRGVETAIIEADSIELPVQLDLILSQIERKFLEAALLKTHGAKKRAAELLGINFRSMRYRLQKFGISEESLKD